MKLKRISIIVCSLLFFLAALTFYLNRVIFPQLIKKIAIERIEQVLKRKVEIGSIHLNWVRGFVIDKIKIYEKDSDDIVMAQADQVSFGLLFFPGTKHYRITVPFINVRSPSVHLVRSDADTWNFSDMFPAAANANGTSTPAPAVLKPSPFEIAWGGITVSDGKFLVDDLSSAKKWSEFFDNINLKLSLSYKGISYDFTADIPGKKGFVGATVYYQPITKNTQAQIQLKNIDTASYLSLVNIPDVHWDSGIIKDIDLDINYSQDNISAQGNVLMKDLDITSHDQGFKGDIEIHGLNAQYLNGDITARGQMALSKIQTHIPGLTTGGSVQTQVDDFELTKEGVTFIGSLHAQDIFVRLKDRQVQADGVALDNIKVRKDKDGIQSVGSIETKGLFVQWPNQNLRGDFSLKAVTMHMRDENNINVQGDLQANNFSTNIDDKNFSSRHILLENAQLDITDQKNIDLDTKLSVDAMILGLGANFSATGSIKTDKLHFNLMDGIIKTSAILDASQGHLVLDGYKTIDADPQIELNLQMPLSAPGQMTYKGSVTLSDGHLRGFEHIPSLDNFELDTDFQNDQATINALSVNVLDTNVRIYGTVKNFKHLFLNVIAEADELNLSKFRELSPKIVDQYGLDFDGSSSVKVKFEGLMSDPLAAKVQAVATVKNVGVFSSKFHQRIKNITGTIEATPNSLKWREFSGTYLNKKYTLSGSMDNFKNPEIHASIEGPDIQLNTDIVTNNSLITINTLTGKYLKADFDTKGTILLGKEHGPIFNLSSNVSLLLENLLTQLPVQEKKNFQNLNPSGTVSMTAQLKGTALDWKNYSINAAISSPGITLMGYKLNGMKIGINKQDAKAAQMTFDGTLYDGTVHAVGSLDLTTKGMPYDLALNIDNTDMHEFKMDSPLKMQEIDGKFFLTTIAHGTMADFKDNLHATGSLAIRDGFLGEFNLFKGLLGVLNDALRLGQVEITDVESNFTIDNQKIHTDNLRLKGPTIVLLGKGWVNFDQDCDLHVTVDLSSGIVPAIAHDVLNTLDIHIYDKIGNPKFKKKISVPQVINSLLKNLLQ